MTQTNARNIDTEIAADAELPAELRAGSDGERVLAGNDLGAALAADHVLLAIDTALGTSVALGVGDHIYEVTSDDPLSHAEVIGDLIERVLTLADVPAAMVTGVVMGVGPGPFTGLRVGIAAAHAFALGAAAPLYPLQGHEAVALAMQGVEAPVPRLRVVQDARRRELFITEYAGLDQFGIPVRTTDPALWARAEYGHSQQPSNPDGRQDVWPERIPAARLVQLAARRLTAAHSEADATDLELVRGFEPDRALYLRAPDVKAPSAPKRVST
ncbi:MAG: tRNA (adenosine(37)-N6)-threonylcarbamoyltransferase complex dimerization subunit type 1 TsaB [Leucobacter sp.]